MSMLRPLRPHQDRAITELRNSLARGCGSPLLMLPTGAGKTVVAAHIVSALRDRGKRICFTVPTIDLVDQTMERFVENGIDMADMGALQGNHPWRRPHAPIQVATGQTLARRAGPDVDVVIVDEAHRRFQAVDDWMVEALGGPHPALARASSGATRLPRPFFIGLSATPWARGMGLFYDDLIRVTSMAELIEGGYLSPFRVFAPSTPDLAGVKTVAGDYHEGQLAERMNREELVADVVTTWQTLGQGRPTLCFATGRKHAQALHERFEAAGVPAAYIDANTPRDERAEIGRKLEAGAIKVAVNIGCLTTGIDWDVRCLILARPTKSEQLFVQIIGRALRTAPGKDHAIILDHSSTHQRLGMVTDIDHDTLDDGKPLAKAEREAKERNMPLPALCEACTALMPFSATECPCCGFARPRPVFREQSGILEELRPGGKRVKAPSAASILAERDKRDVFAMLDGYRQERGRSSGWAAHAYREIFGVWPRGMDGVEPLPPDDVVRAYIRAKDIRWAKSQPKREVAHA